MIPSVFFFLWVQIVDMDFDIVLGTIGKKITYEYLCFLTVSGMVLDIFFNGVGYSICFLMVFTRSFNIF